MTVLPLMLAAAAAATANPFAGDYGYPFHSGVGGPNPAMLTHVQGTIVDAAYGRRDAKNEYQGDTATQVSKASTDDLSLTVMTATSFGLVLGAEGGWTRNHGILDTNLLGSELAQSQHYGRDMRDANLFVSVPLFWGLSAGLRYSYYWVADYDDSFTLETLGGGSNTGHTSFSYASPSLTYTGRRFQVTVMGAPEVSRRDGVVDFESPAELEVLTLWKTGRRGTIVLDLTDSDWSRIDQTETRQLGVRFGPRQRTGAFELGAFFHYQAAYHKTNDDATPDNVGRLGFDLEGRAHYGFLAGGWASLLVGYLSGSETHDRVDQGTVNLTSGQVGVQLAITQGF